MTDEPDNLVLVYLRRLEAGQADLRAGQSEMLVRVTDLARQVAGLRRDQAGDAETSAHLQAQLDQMRGEISRIKRRLDITD